MTLHITWSAVLAGDRFLGTAITSVSRGSPPFGLRVELADGTTLEPCPTDAVTVEREPVATPGDDCPHELPSVPVRTYLDTISVPADTYLAEANAFGTYHDGTPVPHSVACPCEQCGIAREQYLVAPMERCSACGAVGAGSAWRDWHCSQGPEPEPTPEVPFMCDDIAVVQRALPPGDITVARAMKRIRGGIFRLRQAATAVAQPVVPEPTPTSPTPSNGAVSALREEVERIASRLELETLDRRHLAERVAELEARVREPVGPVAPMQGVHVEAKREREAVVAFLRRVAAACRADGAPEYATLEDHADAIALGDHRSKP